MKPKIIIKSFTSCSGCISALISLDMFPQFLERSNVINFPFISDNDSFEDCDIAIIEGCISEDSQIDLLKSLRKSAKKVIALGSCAAFGGISSLSEKEKSLPINAVIEIDGFIPGCAPPSKMLGNSLLRLIENKNIILPEKNLCATCPLRSNIEASGDFIIDKIMPDPSEIHTSEEDSACLLKRGILCMGPVTRDGCEQRCIKFGVPCEGCLGPVSKDYISNLVNFLSLIIPSRDLRKYEGLFFRFAKPRFNLGKQALRGEENV